MFRKVMNKSFRRVIMDKIFLLYLLETLKEKTWEEKEILYNDKFFILSENIGDYFYT